jgi:hypothetical protein
MADNFTSLSGSELISAFRKGEFELDCIHMQLAQNKDEKPIVCSGRGYIRVAKDGRLEFKIYATDVTDTDAFAAFKSTMAVASGTIYASTDFYTLTAIDQFRNSWTADRILPDASWPGPVSLPIVEGRMDVLRTTSGQFSKPSKEHLLRLHFFDDGDVPYPNLNVEQTPEGQKLRRDHARFAAAGCDFLVAKGEAEFTVEAESDTEFRPHFETRIVEALQFLLARSLLPRILVRNESKRQSLELTSANPKSIRPHLHPPLAPGYQGYYDHAWNLFSRYLDYVLRSNDTMYWHSCSYHLHNACEASANSIDAWAIGVCLAVEGISSLVEVPQTKEEKKLKKDICKSLTEFIDAQHWDEKFTRRLKGLVGQLQSLRVIDRLEPLRALGSVDEAHVGAWSKLRNRQAHPKYSDLKNLDMREVQAMLDMISKTTVLMYLIVFHLIGYTGKYVDYGTHRYPVRDYPPSAPKLAKPVETNPESLPTTTRISLKSTLRTWCRAVHAGLCALFRCTDAVRADD